MELNRIIKHCGYAIREYKDGTAMLMIPVYDQAGIETDVIPHFYTSLYEAKKHADNRWYNGI